MKKHHGVAFGGGEYTYTSERKKLASRTEDITELIGYFHISNEHPGSLDSA